MNPIYHAESSAKKWGGTVDDYLKIHEKMDCSKAYFSDNRHRVLTHTMFWVNEVMLPIFGSYIEIEGKKISVKDICERHILEDYRQKFIPTVQDFVQELEMKPWMQNGNGLPDSVKKFYKKDDPAPIRYVSSSLKTHEFKPYPTFQKFDTGSLFPTESSTYLD